MRRLGTIAELWRYPVKSMAGLRLETAAITFHGIAGDREYAFVRSGARGSFPWMTAREMPEMLRYQPEVAAGGGIAVRGPEGAVWGVQEEAMRQELEARSGRGLFLLRDYRGSFDAAPLSLISRQTVAHLTAAAGLAAEPARFRASLVVDLGAGGAPMAELGWVGKILQIGAVRIAITEADRRCAIINLDPRTAAANPAMLREVTERHAQCAGVYATVLTEGEIRTGDSVALAGE